MEFLYVKAIHIVFVVSWFAALFYIVRLFIYATEAQEKDEVARPILTQQLLTMQRKLWYIIGWPAAVGTHVFGWWMVIANAGVYLAQPWMWIKIIAVCLLSFYHLQCQRIFSQQRQGVYKHSSFKLRLFNELATVFLVAIVFLVVVKSQSGMLWGLLGLIAFAGIMVLLVYIYKKSRDNDSEQIESGNPQTGESVKKD
jgi:protoporphyrinogen IX oxidase